MILARFNQGFEWFKSQYLILLDTASGESAQNPSDSGSVICRQPVGDTVHGLQFCAQAILESSAYGWIWMPG